MRATPQGKNTAQKFAQVLLQSWFSRMLYRTCACGIQKLICVLYQSIVSLRHLYFNTSQGTKHSNTHHDWEYRNAGEKHSPREHLGANWRRSPHLSIRVCMFCKDTLLEQRINRSVQQTTDCIRGYIFPTQFLDDVLTTVEVHCSCCQQSHDHEQTPTVPWCNPVHQQF